jgi:hypothetical protein
MAQLLTLFTLAVLALGCWLLYRRFTRPCDLVVSVRLAHVPRSTASHLIWTVANTTNAPVAVARLIVHETTGPGVVIATALPAAVPPQRALVFPSDVDWTVLTARSIGVIDEAGREHVLPRKAFSELKRQLHRLIDYREDRREQPRVRRGRPRARVLHADVGARDWMTILSRRAWSNERSSMTAAEARS